MKRSTKVALTLFLPAISSFGCDTAKKWIDAIDAARGYVATVAHSSPGKRNVH
jgi:hypothetical protein